MRVATVGTGLDLTQRTIRLDLDGEAAEGLLVWNDAADVPCPGVLVAPTIRGRTAFEEDKARALAALGYAALVIDIYGIDTRGCDIAVLREHMNALRADREKLQRYLLAWLDTCRQQPEIDSGRIAAIGFCFGGLCVLDIARSGFDVAGVVSFHGLFDPPGNTAGNKVSARVLALHGWEDPLATPEQVVALSEELTAMGADWQIHAYGNTLHAFTNPAANDYDAGTVYNASADRRSWAALQAFFAELFGP